MIHHVFIQDCQNGSLIGTRHCRRDSSNLYVLDTLNLSSTACVINSFIIGFLFCQGASSSLPPMWVLIVYLIHEGRLGRIPIDSSFHCKCCSLGKQVQPPYSNSTSHSTRPFDLIHSDVWGRSPFASNSTMSFSLMTILATLGFIL